MANKLEGKVALITGGANGIGLATAKRFVSKGPYVFIIDRDKNELDKAVSDVGENVSSGIQSDVSNLADLDKLYDTVKLPERSYRHFICKCGHYTVCPIGKDL